MPSIAQPSVVFEVWFEKQVALYLQPCKHAAPRAPLVASQIVEKPPPYASPAARELLEVLDGYQQERLFVLPWHEVSAYLHELQAAPLVVRGANSPLRWVPGQWRPTFRSLDFGDGVLLCLGDEDLGREADLFAWGGSNWVLRGDALIEVDHVEKPYLEQLFPLPRPIAPTELEHWRGTWFPFLESWTQVIVEDRQTDQLMRTEPVPVADIRYGGRGWLVTACFQYPPSEQLVAAGSQAPLVEQGKRYLRDWKKEEEALLKFDAIFPQKRTLMGQVWVEESEDRTLWDSWVNRLRKTGWLVRVGR